jgi:hypothetical protein
MTTKPSVRAAVEVVGVASVVLSVVFLAMQVQQANQQARVSYAHDLQASYNGWHELLISVPGAADLLMSSMPDSALTPGEARRRRSLIVYLFNIWMTVHTAWENGLISDLDYEGYTNDVRSMTEHPVAVGIMRDLLDHRYPEAQSFPIFAPAREAR